MDHKTNNPVFDWKADERSSIAAVQNTLLKVGLVLGVVSGLVYLISFLFIDQPVPYSCVISFVGWVLTAFGVIYGIHKRNQLRDEFRKEFGVDKFQSG